MNTESTYFKDFKKKLLELQPIQRIEIKSETIGTESPDDLEERFNLVIQAVDAMDSIYLSALKLDLKEWGAQIEIVINDYLRLLESYGIEEIKSLGQFINSDTMTSIGTIPESFQEELKKFQVYGVIERGFRHKGTGRLIREAKVITVY